MSQTGVHNEDRFNTVQDRIATSCGATDTCQRPGVVADAAAHVCDLARWGFDGLAELSLREAQRRAASCIGNCALRQIT